MLRIAKCCRPVPGDPILGYISLGKGITIHHEDCPNARALKKNPERFTPVSWEGDSAASFRVELQVDGWDRHRLRADLEAVGRRLELEAISLGIVEEVAAPHWQASHVVTVYGLDHPGIVHAAATALAERGVDITDLSTQLVTDEEPPLYGLLMEVAIPGAALVDEVRSALEEVGAREGVRVSLRELQQATL